MTFVKTVDTKVVAIAEFPHRDILNHEAFKAAEQAKTALAEKRCEKMGWDELGSSINFEYDKKDTESAEIEQAFIDRLIAIAEACDMRGLLK